MDEGNYHTRRLLMKGVVCFFSVEFTFSLCKSLQDVSQHESSSQMLACVLSLLSLLNYKESSYVTMYPLYGSLLQQPEIGKDTLYTCLICQPGNKRANAIGCLFSLLSSVCVCTYTHTHTLTHTHLYFVDVHVRTHVSKPEDSLVAISIQPSARE